MDGYILTYTTTNAIDITSINNKLFGRVIKIKRNNNIFLYYYKGILDNILYYKISNGSYFIPINNNNLEILNTIINIRIRTATIELNDSELYTARQYHQRMFDGKMVKNLWLI